MTEPDRHDLTPALTLLMASACGLMVANLYYAQTLIDTIAPAIGLSDWAAGAIVTLTQLGYGLGTALIVPLSDLFENRRLILVATSGAILGSIGIALAHGAALFLAASLLTGICSVGAQVLVPLASHLSSPARQGRTIGLVMSGLLTGIMLARPFADFVAALAGWRAVFWASAAIMALTATALAHWLPERRPDSRLHYGEILGSMWELVGRYRLLRLRAAYQALMFAAFNLFWTAAPLVLIHRFGFSHGQVGLFALAGAGGALAAPIAGHRADQGKARATTLFAFLLLTVSFLAANGAMAIGSIVAFTAMAVAIDAAVQFNQISGQRLIFALSSEARGRINAACLTIVFVVGAGGSLLGSAAYARGGWPLAGGIGVGIGVALLLLFALFDRKDQPSLS